MGFWSLDEWQMKWLCVSCDKELGYFAIMHNNGVCPKCGHVSLSKHTETRREIGRYARTAPWWKVWGSFKSKHKWEKKGDA